MLRWPLCVYFKSDHCCNSVIKRLVSTDRLSVKGLGLKQTFIQQWLPGLKQLQGYEKQWLVDDCRAGLSVVAVALPVAIAYAQLTGVSAIMGLYSCILPMLVYALCGTSRQLIVGPDAATCAVVAAVVAPLAMGDSGKYAQLVLIMTAMTGLWCIVASRFKLGVFADFLSRPILLGLLNGVAITIMVGQLAKVFGFRFEASYLIEQIHEAPTLLSEIHWQTLLISVVTVIVYFACKRWQPKWPAAMIAIIGAAFLVWLFNLSGNGVRVVGEIQGGLPSFLLPEFHLNDFRELILPALNLAMVSFVSMMLTARSFAAKNGYDIDADKEFRALGLANLASAMSQGFAISGADSRTAVNDANGGKTQVVSVIAALVMGVIALVAYQPLQYIPIAALGVVLIIASTSLLDLKGIWLLRKRDPSAFYLSTITLFSVLVIGVIPGITVAVLLGLFQFLRIVMRPTHQVLGIDDEGVIRTVTGREDVKEIPGLVLYRFNSPLTYFNAPFFKRCILDQVESYPETPNTVIVDAVACLIHMDLSVMMTLNDVQQILKRRGIQMILAGRRTTIRQWCERTGVKLGEDGMLIRSDMYLAIRLNESYREALVEGDVALLKKEPEDAPLEAVAALVS